MPHKAGISDATYYNWKKKYGGPLPTEMTKLKPPCDKPVEGLVAREMA